MTEILTKLTTTTNSAITLDHTVVDKMMNVRHLSNYSGRIKSIRFFSVKELPWCSPSDSPVRLSRPQKKNPRQPSQPSQIPIDRFGIVAAVSKCKNRVIGVNGGLPWKIPQDVERFKSLTGERILIVGRRTFEECPSLAHVNHTKYCIVISKSMKNFDDFQVETLQSCELKIAGSLTEALHLARTLVKDKDGHTTSLQCWIGGGEKVFEEALRHPSAAEIHLSWVDVEIDITSSEDFSRFPAKYRWDNKFKIFSEKEYPGTSTAPRFTYTIYKPQRA